MRVATLMTLIALTAVPAFAHEVQPPPPLKESCAAVKWLGNALAGAELSDPEYSSLDTLTSRAFDECERYQGDAVDWVQVERDMDAAIERANRAVTKCE